MAINNLFFLLILWILFCSGFWRFCRNFCISWKLRKSILAWQHRGSYALAGFPHKNVFPSGLRKSVKIATIFTYKIYRKSNSKNTWKFNKHKHKHFLTKMFQQPQTQPKTKPTSPGWLPKPNQNHSNSPKHIQNHFKIT